MRTVCSSSKGQISLEPLESRQFLSVAPLIGLPTVSTTPPPISTTPTATPIRGIGLTFNAISNQLFSGLVGELSGVTNVSHLNATINWGDGTATSPGKFVFLPTAMGVPGLVGIAGQHTYASPGQFAVSIIVTEQLGPPGSLTPIVLLLKISSTALVSTQNGQGVTLFEPANEPFTAAVGTFNYVPPLDPSGSPVNTVLSAKIDWGDGNASAGLIQYLTDDEYAVIGTHEYTAVGKYRVHIVVVENLVPVSPGSTTTPPTRLIADFFSTINALPSPIAST